MHDMFLNMQNSRLFEYGQVVFGILVVSLNSFLFESWRWVSLVLAGADSISSLRFGLGFVCEEYNSVMV